MNICIHAYRHTVVHIQSCMPACTFMHICKLMLQMPMAVLRGAGSGGVIEYASAAKRFVVLFVGCPLQTCVLALARMSCPGQDNPGSDFGHCPPCSKWVPNVATKLSIHVLQFHCALKAVVGFVQLLHVTLDAMLANQGTLWPRPGLKRKKRSIDKHTISM